MHDIDLVDESFLLRFTDTYHLSVQTGLSGLSFAILDLNKLRYVVLRHYPFEGMESTDEIANYLSVIYKVDNLLSRKYKNISHLYVGNMSTIIPKKDFDDKKAPNYLRFLFDNTINQVTLFNSLPLIESNNIFSYPELLFTNVNQLFKGVGLFHHTTSFLSFLISESSQSKEPICHIFLSDGMINIGIAKDSMLLFFNTFEFREKSDIAYFILSVLEQFNMPAQSTKISIASDTKDHDEIFDFLNNFLGQIRFIRPSNKFTYSMLFDELYLTRFANLFNLALCE